MKTLRPLLLSLTLTLLLTTPVHARSTNDNELLTYAERDRLMSNLFFGQFISVTTFFFFDTLTPSERDRFPENYQTSLDDNARHAIDRLIRPSDYSITPSEDSADLAAIRRNRCRPNHDSFSACLTETRNAIAHLHNNNERRIKTIDPDYTISFQNNRLIQMDFLQTHNCIQEPSTADPATQIPHCHYFPNQEPYPGFYPNGIADRPEPRITGRGAERLTQTERTNLLNYFEETINAHIAQRQPNSGAILRISLNIALRRLQGIIDDTANTGSSLDNIPNNSCIVDTSVYQVCRNAIRSATLRIFTGFSDTETALNELSLTALNQFNQPESSPTNRETSSGGSSDTGALLAVAAIGGAIYWWKHKNPNFNPTPTLTFAALPTSDTSYHAQLLYTPNPNHTLTLTLTQTNLLTHNPIQTPEIHTTANLTWQYHF